VDEETGEIFLHCHSSAREAKEKAMQNQFSQRFEAALDKLNEGLSKKGSTKFYDKILQRIGRLRQRYSSAAQHYQIEVDQDQSTGKATGENHGRTASYPTTPVQIPACGITAPGSSELLASHFITTQEILEIMTYPWFCYFKVFYQRFKPNYIIALALTPPIKPFVKELSHSISKTTQAFAIPSNSVEVIITE
jgi:hypothetical protein